jgi:hypothetical protein
LFALHYSTRLNSAEASYISISRYMRDRWPDLPWWPIWFNGIPGHTVYPPLFHALVALGAKLQHADPALAHHQLSALLYALGPIGVFALAARLYGSIGASLAAASVYSLLSPAAFLVPWVRTDIGGLFRPWRLYVLVVYGDAPHMFALALIPFALLSLDAALARRKPWLYLVTAMLLASIALTNWLGSVAMACAVTMYLLATTTEDWRDLPRWGITALISASAYVLACPWIPPSAVRLIQATGQLTSGDVRPEMQHFFPRAIVLLLALALMKVFFQKFRVPVAIQFAAFFLVVPGSFPLLHAWARMSILPQAHRYQFEMELAVCLLLTLLIHRYLLRNRLRALTWGATGAVVVLACFQIPRYREYAAALIRPIDMAKTTEFQVADWLNHHAPSSRVFAIGTVSFWLNSFSDVTQMTGAVEAATPSRQIAAAIHGVSSGKAWGLHDGDLARLWLQAYGADMAVVGQPRIQDYYGRYEDTPKFDRFSQQVWNNGGEAIYLLPRRSRSLAQVVGSGDIVVHSPRDEFAVAEVSRYVRALDNPAFPLASFSWMTNHAARVSVDLPPGDAVSLQITYDPGWHAYLNRREVPLQRDGLGLTAMRPPCSGPCQVDLIYERGLEGKLTRIASAMACAVYLALCLFLQQTGFPARRAKRF